MRNYQEKHLKNKDFYVDLGLAFSTDNSFSWVIFLLFWYRVGDTLTDRDFLNTNVNFLYKGVASYFQSFFVSVVSQNNP